MPLNLTTMVVSRVSKVPYIGEPHEKPLKVHEVKIRAIPIPEPKPDIVPLWIIILSACIGVIILLLLIYLLYKVTITTQNGVGIKHSIVFYLDTFSAASSTELGRITRKSDNHSIEIMATTATNDYRDEKKKLFVGINLCIKLILWREILLRFCLFVKFA